MTIRTIVTLFFAVFATLRVAQAQDLPAYIQIQAWPTAEAAEAGLENYASYLPDVAGFSLGNGLFAAVLGPYPRDEAVSRLQQLRASGQIPGDSYISYRAWYDGEFWNGPSDTTAPEPEPEAEPLPEVVLDDSLPQETPAQARASEAQMSRAERDQIQIALKWAGFYNGGIDGAFGRGTRNSMASWQSANGFEATGILTTAQRAALVGQYNAILDGLGLEAYSDDKAGIRMKLPLEVVSFTDYQAPFVHFDPVDSDLPAQVLLISQAGDSSRLAALYEILQTVAIMPEGGARNRSSQGFTMEGRNSRIISHAEASLQGGEIKGFILVWPTGDEERRTRLLAEMQASFTRLPGSLPFDESAGAQQSVDLVSGLEIRKPAFSRSGVYVTRDGAVATLLDGLESCGQITLAGEHAARIATSDAASGLALLRPEAALAPMGVAQIAASAPRIGSEIAVAGYSYEGLLGAASVTYGTLADVRGLDGETGLSRLEITTLAGDAGGPVLDGSGSVVGLLMGDTTAGRDLPGDVAFAVDGTVLASFLSDAGIAANAAVNAAAIEPLTLAREGREMTALVSCWE